MKSFPTLIKSLSLLLLLLWAPALTANQAPPAEKAPQRSAQLAEERIAPAPQKTSKLQRWVAKKVVKRLEKRIQKRMEKEGYEPVTNGFAIASIATAGAGAILLFVIGPFAGILALLGIIFGIIGLVQCNRYYDEFVGRGLAIAGIVIGALTIVLPFLLLILLLGILL